MAVLEALRRWLRRPSTGVFPLYVDGGANLSVIRCWLCKRALWSDNVFKGNPRILAIEQLIRVVDKHREVCQ